MPPRRKRYGLSQKCQRHCGCSLVPCRTARICQRIARVTIPRRLRQTPPRGVAWDTPTPPSPATGRGFAIILVSCPRTLACSSDISICLFFCRAGKPVSSGRDVTCPAAGAGQEWTVTVLRLPCDAVDSR